MAAAESRPGPGRAFRKKLSEELPSLVTDGLLDQAAADSLTERYRLKDLGAEGHSRLLTGILLVGSSLVAAGVISFVAAHWDAIPKALKVGLLLAAMLGSAGGGYWLWKVRGTHPVLGHALVFLGTLIMGANIGLFAQIFHAHSSYHNGLIAWAAGAALMAAAMASVPHSALALGLLTTWYFCRAADFERANLLFPVLVLGGLGLAWQQRSRFVAFLALAAFCSGMLGNAAFEPEVHGGLVFVLTGVALAAVCWCAARAVEGPAAGQLFAGPLRLAAGLLLAGFGSVLSFREVTREVIRHGDGFPLGICVSLGALMALLAAAAAAASFRKGARGLRTLEAAPWGALLLFGLMLLGLVSASQLRSTDADGLVMLAPLVLVNIAVAGYGAILAWRGAVEARRGLFWAGLLLVVGVLVARFFEYTEGLLVKSLIFLLAGVAVIVGGVKFENLLRRRREERKGAPRG